MVVLQQRQCPGAKAFTTQATQRCFVNHPPLYAFWKLHKATNQATWRRRMVCCSRSTDHQLAGATAPSTHLNTQIDLLQWCIESKGLIRCDVEPVLKECQIDPARQEVAFVTTKPLAAGDLIVEIPGDLAVTAVDVEKDQDLAGVGTNRSELVGLALFVLSQNKSQTCTPGQPDHGEAEAPSWGPLIDSLFCGQPPSPVLWSDNERESLLQGSQVLEEARARETAIRSEWPDIIKDFPHLKVLGDETDFLNAMMTVLAKATYLPAAQCFALLPIISSLRRTGSASGATLDYDFDRETVVLKASRKYEKGEEVRLFDGRSSGELFMATGTFEPSNPSDYITLTADLVPADKLYNQKASILTELGFEASTVEFPVAADRISTQHLAFLRLSRLTNAAQFPLVQFDADVIISQENEYEVLQLLMADVRERLQGYATQYEDDLKELQRRDLGWKERAAAALRVSEKRILQGTMDGVRRRLAPIRGIPTKDGSLADPNADLKEVFDVIESIPSAPKRFLDGLASWARGEADPEWGNRNKKR